jgi:hypothetical protein
MYSHLIDCCCAQQALRWIASHWTSWTGCEFVPFDKVLSTSLSSRLALKTQAIKIKIQRPVVFNKSIE